jgi:hypothetical protein
MVDHNSRNMEESESTCLTKLHIDDLFKFSCRETLLLLGVSLLGLKLLLALIFRSLYER